MSIELTPEEEGLVLRQRERHQRMEELVQAAKPARDDNGMYDEVSACLERIIGVASVIICDEGMDRGISDATWAMQHEADLAHDALRKWYNTGGARSAA